ncbi:MAG: phosphatase PAP2 family protein [Cytophagaceae bacterium]|nr:phosphatase PAP2 family protein [Cytophagaceae bacterium]
MKIWKLLFSSNTFIRIRVLSLYASIVWLALVVTVYLGSFAFTAIQANSVWTSCCLFFTHSGGKMGTGLLLLGTALIYALRSDDWKERSQSLLKTILFLGGLIALMAFFNEHVTKKIWRVPRPSHQWILRQQDSISLEALVAMPTGKRQETLRRIIHASAALQQTIAAPVQEHWIYEAGYSFPSGHSFNAFLLAVMIAYSMIYSRIKWLKYMALLPLIWAFMVGLSRVALGAHSALDVSVGGLMGMLLALLFLYADAIRHWIIVKRD